MRLRVVSTLTSGRISGVDVFALHLTEGLVKRGVDARLLFTNPDRIEVDQMPLPPHATTEQLPEDSREKRRHRRRALREYLAALAPCVYLPNYDYDHSPVCAYLPDSVATIGIVHSDDPMHYDHVRVLGRFWNAVVGVSSHTTKETAKIFPRPDRVFRIPYGVPVLPSFAPRVDRKPGEIRLLYVGRLEQSQKRVLDMIELLDRLEGRRIPARLTLVGDGPARSRIEESGRRHIEAGALRLYGARRNDEMPEMYLDADVFLLTSAFEGLPVSLLEAMAFGCVPVATNVKSGVPEVVQQGVNGFLVDVGDVEAMANRIERLQREPAEIERMGEAARRSMEAGEHSLDRMVDRYLELFSTVDLDLRSGRFRRPSPFPGELAYRRLQCRVGRNLRRLRARP